MTMSMSPRSKPRLLVVAGLAVVAAWLCSSVSSGVDQDLHALYVRETIGMTSG